MGAFRAGMSRYPSAQHVQVFSVNQRERCARWLLARSDPIDAQTTTRAVLNGRTRAWAKSDGGPVHSARTIRIAKDSAVKARTQASTSSKTCWS